MRGRKRALFAAALAAGLALTACSSSGTSGAGNSGSGSATAGSGADLAAAQALLAPYVGKPSAFPVDKPLSKRLPGGTTIEFLQCGAPFCGLIAQALQGATKVMGVQFKVVKAGVSATELQSAMQTIIADKPDGVVLAGVEPTGITQQIAQLEQNGVAIGSTGLAGASKYGIKAASESDQWLALAGQLLAAAVVEDKQAKTNAVFYNTTELSFSPVVLAAYQDELKKLCPGCQTRTTTLPLASFGTTAPSTVVSDLQRNPNTNVAIFPSLEATAGVTGALRTAGVTVDVIGGAPTPQNLQDLKAGAIKVGVTPDNAVNVWTTLDMVARLINQEPLTSGEQSGIPPVQVLKPADITFDPTNGWTGYPDFAQRFGKLWGVASS